MPAKIAKIAKANVALLRQETQFSCCAASIASALKAHGKDMTEAGVNKVLGASPMGGATWEAMLATVQYFGLRGTLVVPSTIAQLKGWTDAGIPVVIAWNPEGRPWSHASCVFHVDDEQNVHVMDPNIPDPSETVRVVPKSEFYRKWAEAVGDNLIVRRPAMAIEREVTADGRQVMASGKEAIFFQGVTREMDRLRREKLAPPSRSPSHPAPPSWRKLKEEEEAPKVKSWVGRLFDKTGESEEGVMAGKKERRSLKDKSMARFLERGPVRPADKSDAAKAMSKAQWELRKEEGRAGLPGAGLGAGYHKDKSQYNRGNGKGIEREAESLTQPLMTRRDYGAVTASDYASILKYAVDLPADVERYVEEGTDAGMPEDKAWAVAWSRYCVAADTYVFTSLGVQTIGELAKQSVMERRVHADGAVAAALRVTVATHKGQGLSSHVVQTGVKPVVKVTTKHGYSLTCTPDHQLLALNTEDYSVEWVNAGNCTGRYLAFPPKGAWGSQTTLPKFTYTTNTHNNVVPFRCPTEMTPTLARVLGYLVSEGAITDEGVQFSNTDPVVVADYVRCMTTLFGSPPKVTWRQPDKSNGGTKPCANARSRTRWYGEFFSSLGLRPGVAQDKQVPDVVLAAPSEFVTEFLRGFIEGDGYVGDAQHPNRVDLTTSSPTLARQLHLLLFNLGVLSTLERNARGYFNIRVHSAPMVQKFVDTVGGGVFKVPVQNSTRLKQRGSEFDCVPAAGLTRLHTKIANKFPGTGRISLSRIKSNWGLLEVCAGGHPVIWNLRDLMGKGYSFDPVATITNEGEAEVYDLSVPGDESFVANGMVAHNCKYKNPESEHCQMNKSEYFPGRKAKFERGVSMTVDEVADVVGPEFKEMNEDPPESVKKVMEGMQGKTARRSPLLAMEQFADMLRDGKFEEGVPADPTENMSPEDAAEWERQTEEHKDEFKTADLEAVLHRDDDGTVPFDLFFNRTAAPKLVWKVNRVMGAQYAETPVGTYWIHPEGRHYEVKLDQSPVGYADRDQYAEDPSAEAKKMVEAHYAKALRGKTAAVTAGGKWGFTKGTESACTAGVNKLSKSASRIAKALYAKDEGSVGFLQKHSAKAGSKTASMLLKAMEDIGPMAALAKNGKTAGKSGNGLYGFSEKTAKLGLDACSALHHEAGVIAADLFARKGADPVKVAGYLTANAKKGKCAFSDLLAEVAPDVALEVTGTVKKKATGGFDTNYIGGSSYSISAPKAWLEKLIAAFPKSFPRPRIMPNPNGPNDSLFTKNEKVVRAAEKWFSENGLQMTKKASDFLASDDTAEDDEVADIISKC